MKVIHIESGLGNQMLSYCEYLAIKKMNPKDDCYIETMVYDIPECNETICQWNGYELGRVFGIDTPNVRSLFEDNVWLRVMEEVRSSRFWENHWNWPPVITQALNNAGLSLENAYGDRAENSEIERHSLKGKMKEIHLTESRMGTLLRRLYYKVTIEQRLADVNKKDKIFIKTEANLLAGQRLSMKYCGNGIELIKDEVDKTFIFPDYGDERNREFANFLDKSNSVFIHARRGDMLSANGWCYKYGYFRRAVKHIKKNVKAPVFVFFTNTGSIEWCKQNAKIFGLDYSKDKVYFVDWNTGGESFRDMQLMSHCKHGIITNSTFGWWGAYFIQNPDKITISPELTINTTYHC